MVQYLALRPTRNGLASHYIVAGSKNPLPLGMRSVKKANCYYRLRRVREEQIPEISAFVEIPMVENVPAKSSEKLPTASHELGRRITLDHIARALKIEIEGTLVWQKRAFGYVWLPKIRWGR